MSNPFNQENQEEINAYKKMIISCVAAASLIILLFLLVLYQNTTAKRKTEAENKVSEHSNNEDDGFVYGESNLTSQDLDFWDMYEIEDKKTEKEEEGELTPYKKNDEPTKAGEDSNDKSAGKKVGDDDKEKDGEKSEDRLVVNNSKGEKVYYDILSNVNKIKYDLNKNLSLGEKNRLYYEDENRKTVAGIDLSKDDVVEDFAKVKADGISFAMIRLATRGYASGTIQPDEKFIEYTNASILNGIYVGAYIESAAINEEEAIEEANYIVGAAGGYGLRYPMAIRFSDTNDSARTDKLTMKERTQLAKTFCTTVKGYGYNPVIMASRDYLISKFNLEDLNDYDIWVSDYNNPTDYPYNFSMWKYSDEGEVDGIQGKVGIDISFVKYEEK